MTIDERSWDAAVRRMQGDSIYALGYKDGATDQEAIDNKRTEELLQYLEELEAHYRDLGQYDDGKPIRRVIEYIKAMEE